MHLKNIEAIYRVMHDLRLPPDRKDMLVERRLKKVLISAYKYVPYYRNIMKEIGYDPERDFNGTQDLKKLPITTKNNFKSEDIKVFLKEGTDEKKLYSTFTSGSTGVPLRVYSSKEEYAFKVAKWLRVLLMNGYSTRNKVMSLTAPPRINEGKTILQKFGFLRRMPVNEFIPPEEMVDIFVKYRPHVLYGNRSHIELFALELLRRKTYPDNLKLVVVAGETIHEFNRKLFKKAFKQEIIEVYGSTEVGIIAFENLDRNGMVLCDDLTFIEFLNEKGEEVEPGQKGRVVVTDLLSSTMPFIRYDQGDFAKFKIIENQNGTSEKRITRIIGRDDDKIILPDGSVKSFHIFIEAICKFMEINQLRIIQKSKDLFHMYIATDQEYFDNSQEKMLEFMKKYLPESCTFQLFRVESLSPDATGKLRMLISEIQPEIKKDNVFA